jgi:hypothetical protein
VQSHIEILPRLVGPTALAGAQRVADIASHVR